MQTGAGTPFSSGGAAGIRDSAFWSLSVAPCLPGAGAPSAKPFQRVDSLEVSSGLLPR